MSLVILPVAQQPVIQMPRPADVQISSHLCSPMSSWIDLEKCIPIKSHQDFPFSQVDGGGLPSHPDWSTPNRTEMDVFETLRKTWLQRILDHRLDKVLIAHSCKGRADPPFPAEVLKPFVHDLESWLVQHGHQPNWDIRQHQPMHLHVLHSIQSILQDRDTSWFPSLFGRCPHRFSSSDPSLWCFSPI